MPTPFEHAWQRFGKPASAPDAHPTSRRWRGDWRTTSTIRSVTRARRRSPARTGIFMASSNDFVKSNCCVLCDDRHHFRSLREKYEHLRSKKHLFNYLAYRVPKHCAHLMVERRQLATSRGRRGARRHPLLAPRGRGVPRRRPPRLHHLLRPRPQGRRRGRVAPPRTEGAEFVNGAAAARTAGAPSSSSSSCPSSPAGASATPRSTR